VNSSMVRGNKTGKRRKAILRLNIHGH